MIRTEKMPFRIPAIQVQQPIGVFYVASIDAKFLLNVCYSTPAKVIDSSESGYRFSGGQRARRSDRLKDIARYIGTDIATFPNSIIVGANYKEDGSLVEEEELKWYVEPAEEDGFYWLVIPSKEKVASIIDGQHRLFAFDMSEKNMELTCSVFLDLPVPYHAYIFATININQKKVDRSLAYELFGFGLDQEPPEAWSPETFAVYLARLLNTDRESPLHGHIQIGVQDYNDRIFKGDWYVSMATIVDGIMNLITANPKQDRDVINSSSLFKKKTRSNLQENNKYPLRILYLNTKDVQIFNIIKEYFTVVARLFWHGISERSYIRKTVGIQALFDILKLILEKECLTIGMSEIDYSKYLTPSSNIDFSDPFFQASGKGKVRIKNSIAACNNLIDINKSRITTEERDSYVDIFKKYVP